MLVGTKTILRARKSTGQDEFFDFQRCPDLILKPGDRLVLLFYDEKLTLLFNVTARRLQQLLIPLHEQLGDLRRAKSRLRFGYARIGCGLGGFCALAGMFIGMSVHLKYHFLQAGPGPGEPVLCAGFALALFLPLVGFLAARSNPDIQEQLRIIAEDRTVLTAIRDSP